MLTKPKLAVFTAVAICFCAMLAATKSYENHQAYKAGVYIGKTAFTTADYQNQTCLSSRADSLRRGCEVQDLNSDSVMKNAFASAAIMPSLRNASAIRRGFRDGWREAKNSSLRQ
jgi:hypothetical protein